MTAESNRSRRSRGQKQKTDYRTEVVERCKDRLSAPHFAILMFASAGDEASIAQTLQVTKGTVKSRLHRARKALAELLKADGSCGLCEQPAGTDTVTAEPA